MKSKFYNLIIQCDARLIDAIELIKDNRTRCVIVCMKEKVIGVISEGDILRALLANTDIHAPLEGWVSHDFKFLSTQDYQQALNLMIEYAITIIPILNNNFELVDVISSKDILAKVSLNKEY